MKVNLENPLEPSDKKTSINTSYIVEMDENHFTLESNEPITEQMSAPINTKATDVE